MMRPSYKETKEKKEHNEKKEREQGLLILF